jgi:hypothetical protein
MRRYAGERARLAATNPGIFKDTIGIMDITENLRTRSKNPDKEKAGSSLKKGRHTLKTLSVCDFEGFFRYVETGTEGKTNDREMLSDSNLYLRRGMFFDGDQHVASDG